MCAGDRQLVVSEEMFAVCEKINVWPKKRMRSLRAPYMKMSD